MCDEDGKIIITFMPDNIEAEANNGELAADVAAAAGVGIGRHCGGAGVCGKCRVRVMRGTPFAPLTRTEENLLTAEEIDNGVRLSCCAKIVKSGAVHVVDRVKSAGHSILEGFSRDISEWSPDRGGCGVAVDIGTTTVVCYLLAFPDRTVVDRISFLNPQVAFGDDVISRIAYSSSQSGALERIQRTLTDEMDKNIGIMAKRNNVARKDITEVMIAGNTVMEHLFAGVSPKSIGHSPYKPEFYQSPPFSASDIGIHISETGIVKMIPNVAGYVGADIVAGVAALDIDRQEGIKLLVDIGTNNEIVIGGSKGMFCCATAAGPALEGARIQYGMRACVGAIEKVTLEDGILTCRTIGGEAPKGLCGSGLIDAIALLLNEGIINKSGRFEYPEKCRDERFRERLGRSEGGMVRLLLTDDEHPIYLTQKDIREVQLAVGAVKVGVEVMLEQAGITKDEIAEVCLAGAFGNNIDIESAARVGLIPDVERTKIHGVKNTSGLGACLSLADARFYERAKETAQKMSYVELSSLPDFQKRFVNAMSF
ncbi:ASKHA domain-containing protein [Cloacibacillus evryensis]|uniref:ASKHA domain-containing protein n=1 Tax=Cloacibacillus evryensis TaxID=508460 RepID=UPI003AB59EE2